MATNKPKRKTYSDEFKEFLVQEAISSGRSIASIARDNGINQNLLHNWKREQKAKQAQIRPLKFVVKHALLRHKLLQIQALNLKRHVLNSLNQQFRLSKSLLKQNNQKLNL